MQLQQTLEIFAFSDESAKTKGFVDLTWFSRSPGTGETTVAALQTIF